MVSPIFAPASAKWHHYVHGFSRAKHIYTLLKIIMAIYNSYANVRCTVINLSCRLY